MAYLRKPDDEKRGKFNDDNEVSIPKQRKYHRKMPASQVFTPLEEEDRAAQDRHVKILQQECSNATPSKQVSLSLMFNLVKL